MRILNAIKQYKILFLGGILSLFLMGYVLYPNISFYLQKTVFKYKLDYLENLKPSDMSVNETSGFANDFDSKNTKGNQATNSKNESQLNHKVYDIENTLIIPSINVNGEIHEGEDEQTMNKGLWRIPHSSTPDKSSNTVIVAHRFMWTSGAKTFYHLDKVNPGEEITLIWNKKKYIYKVHETKIVAPQETYIESPTKQPQLTLYTCHPLWTSDKRLVVIAKPVH